MKEVIEKDDSDSLVSRVYELGYLFSPNIKEDEILSVFDSLKVKIQNFGGVFVSEELPKMIPLAYTMIKTIQNKNHKFDSAYFGWIKFEMDSSSIKTLEKDLKLDNNLIRFLIIKTVKENTLYSKKFNTKEFSKRKTISNKEEGVEAVEINKEEIDKEIDALVEDAV